MRKDKRKRVFGVFLILSWIWMGVIFFFSAQPAAESAELSTGTVNWILSYFSENVVFRYLKQMDILEFLVRKLAHAAEYGLLAVFLGVTIYYSRQWKERWQFKAVLFSGLYACTDEFHQLFVPGRSGQVRDIMIDTFGALFGVLFLWCSFWLYERYKKRQYF